VAADEKAQTPAPDNAEPVKAGAPGGAPGGTPGTAPGQEVKGGPPPLDFNIPLPETVNIDRMSRISDVKSIWRSGIKQIEEIFSEHIAKINDLFDDRALEYDKIRDQLITNHEFLKRFYMDMQRELDTR
jgi:hypothetical protein